MDIGTYADSVGRISTNPSALFVRDVLLYLFGIVISLQLASMSGSDLFDGFRIDFRQSRRYTEIALADFFFDFLSARHQRLHKIFGVGFLQNWLAFRLCGRNPIAKVWLDGVVDLDELLLGQQTVPAFGRVLRCVVRCRGVAPIRKPADSDLANAVTTKLV